MHYNSQYNCSLASVFIHIFNYKCYNKAYTTTTVFSYKCQNYDRFLKRNCRATNFDDLEKSKGIMKEFVAIYSWNSEVYLYLTNLYPFIGLFYNYFS